MTFRTAVLGVALALCSVGMAEAQTRTGFHIGVQGGVSFANTEVSAGGLGIDGLGAEGSFAGIHVGLDYQLPGSAVVLGVFGDYSWQKVEFSVTPALLNASLEETYTIGARAGVVVGNAMPYLLVGYTSAETAASFLGTSVSSPTLTGWTAGGGIEFDVAPNVMLALEARYTRFDTETVASVIALDTDQLSAMARLSYRFNMGPASLK